MAEVNWAEKRNAIRQRTLKQARIVVNGVSTMDATLRNMSLTGARVAVPNALALPDTFELIIGDEGLRRECEVMSRNETSAGLRFFKPLTPRELGAEFMNSSMAKDRVRFAPAEPVATVSRPVVSAPPLDSGHASQEGLAKIKPVTLPRAVASQFPWVMRPRARSVSATVAR